MTDFTVMFPGMSRVFLTEGRARADHIPDYMGMMRAGGLEQSFGETNWAEIASPDSYNKFDIAGSVQGATEPPTTTLMGRYAADLTSTMLRLAKAKCPFDLHIHIGLCEDPSDFDSFTKAVVIEQARLGDWSTDDIGTLDSGENTDPVNEESSVTGIDMYELVQLSVAKKGEDVVVNPLNDVVICSNPECGECDDEDDGCQVVLATGESTPGSPGTAPDLIYSQDGGKTLSADDIISLDAGESVDGLACVGEWVVCVSNDDTAIHWKVLTTLLAGTHHAWNRVTTGIAATGAPIDIWSVGRLAFVVGDGGYVYKVETPSAGLTVLDAGVATTQNLNKVHALNKDFVVAVGDSNAIVRAKDGETFEAITGPAGVADNLKAVWLFDKNYWIIGTDAGEVYYTVDGGDNWTQLTNIPVTLTDVNDFSFSSRNNGFMSGVIAGPAGVILRTYNGGQSWKALPEGHTNLPGNDTIEAVAACRYNHNLVIGVGTADDASDGVWIRGAEEYS